MSPPSIVMNGVECMYSRYLHALRLQRVAERLGTRDRRSPDLMAQAAFMLAEIDRAQARAAALIVRRRTSSLMVSSILSVAVLLFLVGALVTKAASNSLDDSASGASSSTAPTTPHKGTGDPGRAPLTQARVEAAGPKTGTS